MESALPENCLIAKIIADNHIVHKQSVILILCKAWRNLSRVTINTWKNNFFKISFEDKNDVSRVLHDSPWSVMGFYVALKPRDSDKTLQEMEFNKGEFWIQAHDLPIRLLTSEYATSTAKLLGKLVDLDCLGEGPQTARDFLRFRVELDLTKPLTLRLFISRPDGSESWVMLKYERLSDFFYRCGCLGHCRESYTNKVIEKFAWKWTSEMRTTFVRRLQAPNHHPSSSPKPHQVPITTNMAQHTLPTPIPATTSPTTPEQYPYTDSGFKPPLQVAIASVTPTYRNSTNAPAPECSNYYVTEPKEPVMLSEQTNLSRPSVSTGVFINTSLAVALSRLAMKCKHDDYSLPGKRMKPLRLGSLDTEHESGNSDTGKEDTQLSDHSSSQIPNYTHVKPNMNQS
ncbi:reverse transcriptase [Tanacetum coccineum]